MCGLEARLPVGAGCIVESRGAILDWDAGKFVTASPGECKTPGADGNVPTDSSKLIDWSSSLTCICEQSVDAIDFRRVASSDADVSFARSCLPPRAAALVVANHDEDSRETLELVAPSGVQAQFSGSIGHLVVRR